MTREEALKLACQYNTIDLLEALGLLKFDEEVTALSIMQMHFESIGASEPSTKAKALFNNLVRCGYKIVRNNS